jgi:hypothetical protein
MKKNLKYERVRFDFIMWVVAPDDGSTRSPFVHSHVYMFEFLSGNERQLKFVTCFLYLFCEDLH